MSKEVAKWADKAMWKAEPSEASKGIRATLISANDDPLGEIVGINKMFVGQTVRDLATITDAERREVLADIKKTVLKMPLEAIRLHFVIEGVHRGITHQIVRQRTAAFAQESMRFAVKEDLKEAVAIPPSLNGTLSFEDLVKQDLAQRVFAGLHVPDRLSLDRSDAGDDAADKWYAQHRKNLREQTLSKGGPQAQRLKWDAAVEFVGKTYMDLVNDGMPAEDARGLTPTNTITKIHYITNLRSFYDTMAMRVSDQAQYEWRWVIKAMVEAMREYGKEHTYELQVARGDAEDLAWEDPSVVGWYKETIADPTGSNTEIIQVRRSAEWQFRELTNAILPVDFALGRRGFGSDIDRPSRTAERVDAFAKMGVPSERWLEGAPEFNIPALRPDEWLLDPNSARLKEGEEFDIFGNRVPTGSGWHWTAEHGGVLYCDGPNGMPRQWANLTDGPSFDINDIIKKEK